jgi:hypothetical protein
MASIAVTAPPAFCARIVRIDEPILSAINGALLITAFRNVFRDRIFSKGYQSKISKTSGRLTAIGLLNRARVKKRREKR